MENTKIVVVDDDQDIRDSLQAILEGRQYTVVTAADEMIQKWLDVCDPCQEPLADRGEWWANMEEVFHSD